MTRPRLRPGRNIAMKVPPHLYDATVRFHRDVLGLEPLTGPASALGFEFGGKNVWIDSVPTLSQAEIWLEVGADDLENAAAHLARAGVVRCDAIEALPTGFGGFWISSPAIDAAASPSSSSTRSSGGRASAGAASIVSDALLDNEPSQTFHRAMGFTEVDRVVHYRRLLSP